MQYSTISHPTIEPAYTQREPNLYASIASVLKANYIYIYIYIYICPVGNFEFSFDLCWIFLNQPFSKNSFRNTIRVSNSLDPDQARHLSGLIWVQTVCKGYQRTTLAGKELIKFRNKMNCFGVNWHRNFQFISHCQKSCRKQFHDFHINFHFLLSPAGVWSTLSLLV